MMMSRGGFPRGNNNGEDGDDDSANELINLFKKVQTHDHEELVEQFSRIMNTEMGVARFFLESSNWSVETAVHTFLASGVGGDEREELVRPTTMPSFKLLTDLSPLNEAVFAPNTVIDMYWSIANDGQEPWPPNTRVTHMDGERLGGLSSVPVAAAPGESIRVRQRLVTPNRVGSFAGRWSLCCPAGYFGEPIWVIVTVVAQSSAARAFADPGEEEETTTVSMGGLHLGGDHHQNNNDAPHNSMMMTTTPAALAFSQRQSGFHNGNGGAAVPNSMPLAPLVPLGADGHLIPGGLEPVSISSSSSSSSDPSSSGHGHGNDGDADVSMEFN